MVAAVASGESMTAPGTTGGGAGGSGGSGSGGMATTPIDPMPAGVGILVRGDVDNERVAASHATYKVKSDRD